MDKAAQEKIAKSMFQLVFLVADKEIEHRWEHLQPSVKRQWNDKAESLIEVFEELGYRKPPDRPELREKQRADIHAIVSKGCRLCDYWDAENYHCILNIPIHPAYPCSLADQILALFDKPPEGEMPILSDEEIHNLKRIKYDPNADEAELFMSALRGVAQAQWESDKKWTRGEK